MAATVLDTKMRLLAQSLIAKYGKTVYVVTDSAGVYDTSTGDAVITEATQTIKGVFATPEQLGFGSGLVQQGKALFMIAARGLSVVPSPSDKLLVDSVQWRILKVNPAFSGEQVAYYVLDVDN